MKNPDGRGRAYWHADVAMNEAARSYRDERAVQDPYGANIDITLFVSCYNEAAYIVETLDTICEAAREVDVSFEIIVIDDGSKDNSPDLVRAYIASHPDTSITLRLNNKNLGLAQNYVDGAFLGRGKYYRLICGDCPEPKETIVAIFRALGKADCIIPYQPDVMGRSARRLAISKAYTRIINGITGHNLHYYNGLAVHLRHNVMRWHTNTKGFGFQAEILCLVLDLGFSYIEIPVAAKDQRQGKSNAINVRNMLSVAHTIIEIANRRLSNIVYSSR